MSIYVADTSVIVKWFNQENEEHVPEALALLDDAVAQRVALFTSDLARYELANALTLGKRLNPSVVRSILERFEELPIELVETTPALFESAADFAQRYNVSVYDAVYAAIAAELGGTLVTANPRHQARIREAFVLPLPAYEGSMDVGQDVNGR